MVGEERIGTPNAEDEGEAGLLIDEGCDMVDLKRENAGLERARQRVAIGGKMMSSFAVLIDKILI